MFFNYNFSILMFILASLMFIFYYKHILLVLISLEFMMVNLTMILYMNMNMLMMNLYFMSFFLSVMVCEAVIGLTVLVYLIRFTGNDYMNLMLIIKW